MTKNLITTLAGVFIILGSFAQAFFLGDTAGDFIASLQASWAQIMAAIGLLFAKDAVKLVEKPDSEK